MKFITPGIITHNGKEKPADLEIEAPDKADARWQANHGVIEASVQKSFPGATVAYDLRRMKAVK